MNAPTRLGRYTLLKKLASGSALETHLARRTDDESVGGEVVLRKLRPKVSNSAEAVDVFRREVAVARDLEHENLGQVFELVSSSEGEHGVVVELVWGEDLRRIAERGMTVGRFMPVEIAVRVAIEVAEALSYLHERRDAAGEPLDLVHGHVSPANVIVSFAGRVKLVNFGVARAEEQVAEAIGARRRQLKYAFMSPEQVEGGDLDHRSDLFSLGTVLYEYTTRKRLFKGSDEVSTMKLVAEADVKAPSESIPSYPPGLERIVLKALSKDREARYQTAIELRDDLQEFLRDEGLETDQAALAEYMTAIFPDRIKEYEKLLGEGYSGPREDLATEIRAGASEPEAPTTAKPAKPTRKPQPPKPQVETAEDGEVTGSKSKLPLPDIKLPPLPELKPPPIPTARDAAEGAAKAKADQKPDEKPAAVRPPVVPPKPPPSYDLTDTPASSGAVDSPMVDAEDEEEVVHALDEGMVDDQDESTDGDEDLVAEAPYAEEPFDDATSDEPSEASGPSLIPLPAGASIRDSSASGDQAAPAVELLRPKDQDSNVITAVHTLRKDHPDAFEEAAERSRTVVKAVGFAMLLALGFIVWYGLTYQWPWENIEPAADRPDVEPRPDPTLPETMPVEVRSTPAGAAVAVNGVIAEGRTPTQVGVVPDMPNTFVFYMDGFETHMLDVEIGATPPSTGLEVSLVEIVQPPDWEPPPHDPDSDMPPITEWTLPMGRLNVSTDPPGATILRNGIDVCRSPCEVDVPADEEQHLTARQTGHLDTIAFTWAYPWDAENDTRFLMLTLREPPEGGQRYSYMELNSTPEGARVRVNGESSGRTQINAPLRIEEMHRIELEPPPDAPDYYPWARTFYPVPGRWQISPVMERIVRDPAQLSLFIDTPGLEETTIYLGPNEIGVGSIETYQIDGGVYELTLSYTPPPDAGTQRRRTVVEVELPMGQHVTTHYAWDGERFALVDRQEGPLVEIEDD